MTKITFAERVPVRVFKRDWNTGTPQNPTFVEKTIYRDFHFLLCDECGSQLPHSRNIRGWRTCSKECTIKHYDKKYKNIVREEINTPGVRPRIAWGEIKRVCFERDLYTCQRCGKTRHELSAIPKTNFSNNLLSLHCHHIIRLVEGGTNHLDNLITLCGECHNKIHFKDATL